MRFCWKHLVIWSDAVCYRTKLFKQILFPTFVSLALLYLEISTVLGEKTRQELCGTTDVRNKTTNEVFWNSQDLIASQWNFIVEMILLSIEEPIDFVCTTEPLNVSRELILVNYPAQTLWDSGLLEEFLICIILAKHLDTTYLRQIHLLVNCRWSIWLSREKSFL